MSLQAMLWALYGVTPEEAEPEERLVLLVLADHAGHDGRGAYPSKKTISEATGLSRATVYRKCSSLAMKGLILLGDQQLVRHIPGDRRPVVYDLPIGGPSSTGLSTGSPGETPPGLNGVSTGSHTGSHAETQSIEPRTERDTRGRARRAPSGHRCRHGVVIGADGVSCPECPRLTPGTRSMEAAP